MPASYQIDKSLGVVFSVGSGVVTDAEMLRHQEQLRHDPDFQPTFSQLLDFNAMIEAQISAAAIQRLAGAGFFAKGARRAIVVNSDVAFGLARMFQMHSDHSGEQIEIFRDLDKARQWLGLPPG